MATRNESLEDFQNDRAKNPNPYGFNIGDRVIIDEKIYPLFGTILSFTSDQLWATVVIKEGFSRRVPVLTSRLTPDLNNKI